MGSITMDEISDKYLAQKEMIEFLNLCNFEVAVNRVDKIHITQKLEDYVKANKEKIDKFLIEIGKDYKIRFWSFWSKRKVDSNFDTYMVKTIVLNKDKLFAVSDNKIGINNHKELEEIEWKYLKINVVLPNTDRKKNENLQKIKKMSSYQNGWNGYNGEKFKSASINTFQTIIMNLKAQPLIAPTGRNSLLLQYNFEDKSVLAFELFNDRLVKAYVPKGDYEKITEETVHSDFTKVINNSWENCNAIR